MFLARLGRHFREQDWFAVIIELLVVIVGLLLAFQADRWREARVDRQQEHEYIDRLIVDVDEDIPNIETARDLAGLRLEFAELLMSIARYPASSLEQPAVFLAAVNQASFTFAPALTRHTFEDLKSTGNMRLILDPDIRDALYEYYGGEEMQRQYRSLQFSVEFKHFELSAGVLTHEQEIFVQDRWMVVTTQNIDELRSTEPDLAHVLAAAERFSNRPDLVDWLPQLRQLHIERMSISSKLLDRAIVLRDALKAYSSSPGRDS